MNHFNTHDKALAIVDELRCFMPAEEGERLRVPGFGELPVPNGQRVVPPTNTVTEIFLNHGIPVATLNDRHPLKTAHFSSNPNFVDTWPVHGVDGTPGAALHPELTAATDPRVMHFIKGDVAAATPADDNSYTGALAHRLRPETGEQELFPDYLRRVGIVSVYVCGLTVGKERPPCVDSTAADLHRQGFEVAVITNAVEAVVPADKQICLQRLGDMGIRLVTSCQVAAEVLDSVRELPR